MTKDAEFILQIVEKNFEQKPEDLKYTFTFKELLELSDFGKIRLVNTLNEIKSFGHIRRSVPTDGNPFTINDFYPFL